ncbi:MAG TPA: lactate utilization protein C [Pseudonocardiaceae bacterium]|jgi:L-lactate dehydrogenase complex protein LldG|nr:lactate utilization protein C [Pseudonocardiaceae bacterium]
MSEAKSDILAKIHYALADRPATAPIPRDYQRTREVGDLLDLAQERIADYKATVHRVALSGLVERITEVLTTRALRRLLAPVDLPDDWRIPGISWVVDEPSAPLSVDTMAGSDGVLTGCAAAIAETGTIILDAGPTQGRRALTLLPDYHLCVIRAEQIVGTVPEAIARIGPARPITFISGPSATSDIEFNRVEGVHGPRTLDVIITD